MGVVMTIKDVPESLAAELRRRAAEHHRSLDREVVAVIEAGLDSGAPRTIEELHARVQAMGLHTPSDSVAIIREDRDAGHRR